MRVFQLLTCMIVCSSALPNAYAYLGGFEADDGYASFLNDVTKFNAGQYGVNAGGGSFTAITPGTGLWQKLQGPLHPTPGTAGGVAYATGHQYYDRTNPGYPNLEQALVITTNADGWGGGPQEYAYTLDSFDLGGVSPASTGGDILEISFWSCSRIFGTGEGGGWELELLEMLSRFTIVAGTLVLNLVIDNQAQLLTMRLRMSGVGCSRR